MLGLRILVCLLCLCAAPAPAGAAASRESIQAPVGGSFCLELPARPSRAMGWRLAADLPRERLELDSVRYRQTDPGQGAGVEVWTFRALWPGDYTVSLEYRRSWSHAAKPAETRLYRVRVTGRAPLGEEAEE